MAKAKNDKRREKQDFYKMAGGGRRDPQSEPKCEAGETTEPTEELPPDGLAKKSPDEDVNGKPQHRRG